MAVQAKKSTPQRAFVLHSYAYSESSLIVDLFTLDNGRMAAIAKGAKRPSSGLRPILLPLQPLLLTYTLAGDGAGDIHTLKGAEWVGGHVMPTGDALLSGMYLNELLLRLLARADPHPALFDAYAGVVRVLASESTSKAALRSRLNSDQRCQSGRQRGADGGLPGPGRLYRRAGHLHRAAGPGRRHVQRRRPCTPERRAGQPLGDGRDLVQVPRLVSPHPPQRRCAAAARWWPAGARPAPPAS